MMSEMGKKRNIKIFSQSLPLSLYSVSQAWLSCRPAIR